MIIMGTIYKNTKRECFTFCWITASKFYLDPWKNYFDHREVLSLCLFVGIGVDDMFVIVQAWSNLSPKEHETQSISERMGLTLKHAVSDLIVCLPGDNGPSEQRFRHKRLDSTTYNIELRSF